MQNTTQQSDQAFENVKNDILELSKEYTHPKVKEELQKLLEAIKQKVNKKSDWEKLSLTEKEVSFKRLAIWELHSTNEAYPKIPFALKRLISVNLIEKVYAYTGNQEGNKTLNEEFNTALNFFKQQENFFMKRSDIEYQAKVYQENNSKVSEAEKSITEKDKNLNAEDTYGLLLRYFWLQSVINDPEMQRIEGHKVQISALESFIQDIKKPENKKYFTAFQKHFASDANQNTFSDELKKFEQALDELQKKAPYVLQVKVTGLEKQKSKVNPSEVGTSKKEAGDNEVAVKTDGNEPKKGGATLEFSPMQLEYLNGKTVMTQIGWEEACKKVGATHRVTFPANEAILKAKHVLEESGAINTDIEIDLSKQATPNALIAEVKLGEHVVKISCIPNGVDYVIHNTKGGKTISLLESPKEFQEFVKKYNQETETTGRPQHFACNINGKPFVVGSDNCDTGRLVKACNEEGKKNKVPETVSNDKSTQAEKEPSVVNVAGLNATPTSTPTPQTSLVPKPTNPVERANSARVRVPVSIEGKSSNQTEGIG